jgi:hypothetical protein
MTRRFSVSVTASVSGHSIDSFQRIALPGEDSQSIVRIKEPELTLHVSRITSHGMRSGIKIGR